jgi:hypothetical protein
MSQTTAKEKAENLIELGEHNAFVLIADISGYTEFIKFSAQEMTHAQIALSELMGAMWDAAQGQLEPLKTEGDAILFAGADNPENIATGIENILRAYYCTRTTMNTHNSCDCRACSSLPGLELKILGHYGRVLFHEFKGSRDITGLTVVTVHRMLKNTITGSCYVALSEAASSIPVNFGDCAQVFEEYPDVGTLKIDLHRFDPTPWKTETPQSLSLIQRALKCIMGD